MTELWRRFRATRTGVAPVPLMLRRRNGRGVAVELSTATVIEAFGTAVRFATFMIPASLGAAEGGYVVTFAALGLGPAAGVSFGLVRRVREATWAGIGLVVFALLQRRTPWAAPIEPLRRTPGVGGRGV